MPRYFLPIAIAGLTGALQAQTDWPIYGHDPGGMRYSPLRQIDTRNVALLQRAWTFHTGKKGRRRRRWSSTA